MNPLAQLIESLSRKPAKGSGFDPDALMDERMDPSIRADLGAGAMEGELRNRLFQAERSTPTPGGYVSPNATSPNEVTALRNMLTGYGAQRQASPLVQQQSEYDTERLNNRTAFNEGFTGRDTGRTPMQEREIYRRKQAETELQQPIKKLEMTQAHETAMQQRQIDATQRMVEAQMAPGNIRAEAMAEALGALQAGGIDPSLVKSVNDRGFTLQSRQNTPQVNPTTALTKLQDARGALGSADPFATWDDATDVQQYFNQGVLTLLQTSPLDTASKETLLQVLRHPQLSVMPLDQIKGLAMQEPGFDERDWAEFTKLYQILKAR